MPCRSTFHDFFVSENLQGYYFLKSKKSASNMPGSTQDSKGLRKSKKGSKRMQPNESKSALIKPEPNWNLIESSGGRFNDSEILYSQDSE